MPITSVGNPEAALGTVVCPDCDTMSKQERQGELQKPFIPGGPINLLARNSLGANAVRELAKRHDEANPKHNIVLFTYDDHHLLSPEQAQQIKEKGVKVQDWIVATPATP